LQAWNPIIYQTGEVSNPSAHLRREDHLPPFFKASPFFPLTRLMIYWQQPVHALQFVARVKQLSWSLRRYYWSLLMPGRR